MRPEHLAPRVNGAVHSALQIDQQDVRVVADPIEDDLRLSQVGAENLRQRSGAHQ